MTGRGGPRWRRSGRRVPLGRPGRQGGAAGAAILILERHQSV